MILALFSAAIVLIAPSDVTAHPWLSGLETTGWSLVRLTPTKDLVKLHRPLSRHEHGRIRHGWVRLEHDDQSAPRTAGVAQDGRYMVGYNPGRRSAQHHLGHRHPIAGLQ